MNLKASMLWQPGFLIRPGILVLCVLMTSLVGDIHAPGRRWQPEMATGGGLRNAVPIYWIAGGQHLVTAIYTAFTQSLASENAARPTAMQAAELNIRELEENLQASFLETRQNAITAELLDIVSGFEAMAPN